ncbi:hypothetical protein niasHT_008160 [Heterodera trifolii]|uniref:Uncharacterized protein n=1 Tax=Heterodera trifolii TaxID=157864 RepID=A0ABD2M0K0_9BILA
MKYLPPELLDEMAFYVYPNQRFSKILTSSWLLLEFLMPRIKRWKEILKLSRSEVIKKHKLAKDDLPWTNFVTVAKKDSVCTDFLNTFTELFKEEDFYNSIDGSMLNLLLSNLRELYPRVKQTCAWLDLLIQAKLFPATMLLIEELCKFIESPGLYFGAVPESTSEEDPYQTVACVGPTKNADGLQSTSSSLAPIPPPKQKPIVPSRQRLPGDLLSELSEVPPKIADRPPPQIKSCGRRLPLSPAVDLRSEHLQKRIFGRAGLSLCPQPSADNSPFPPPQEPFSSTGTPPNASASVQGSVQGQKSGGEKGQKDETSPGSEPKSNKRSRK